MNSYMTLFIQDLEVSSVALLLPPNDDDLDFDQNVGVREAYVKHNAELLRITNTRRILKFEKNYEIYLHVESRAGDLILSEIEMENFETTIANKIAMS